MTAVRRRYRTHFASLPLASRGLRFGAHVLDSLFYLVAVFGIALLGALVGAIEDTSGSVIYVVGGLTWLALGAVQAYFLTTRGQSLGKMIVKVRIVNYPDGARVGFARVFLMRTLLTSVITNVCGLLGAIFGLVDACFIFGERRRCVHDLYAQTMVVPADVQTEVDPSVFD